MRREGGKEGEEGVRVRREGGRKGEEGGTQVMSKFAIKGLVERLIF